MANSVYFFREGSVVRYGSGALQVDPGFPKPIAGNMHGVIEAQEGYFKHGFDTVVNWGNGKAYLFLEDFFLSYDIVADKVDAGYPRLIQRDWLHTSGYGYGIGYLHRLQAVMNWGNGKAYLFIGYWYLRYNVATGTVDPGYPLPVAGNWPGMAEAGFDAPLAAVNWGNGKAYFFQGDQYLRYDIGKDRVDPGYPLPIADYWPGLAQSGFTDGLGIYAVARWGNAREYFFHKDHYLSYATGTDKVDPGYPLAIDAVFPGMAAAGFGDGLDAAVKWWNGKVFFFREDRYVRYDIASDHVDAGYPLPIAGNWAGMAEAGFAGGIDAAVNWWNGKVYFFRGGQYVSYDIQTDKVDAGYPLPIAGNWPGMAEAGFADGIDAAVNWWNGKVYFFRGAQYVSYDIGAGRVDAGYPLPIAGNWAGMSEAGFGADIAAALDLDKPTREVPSPFKVAVKVDPLARLLRSDIYVKLNLPYPVPDEVLVERLQATAQEMTVEGRREALAHVQAVVQNAIQVEQERAASQMRLLSERAAVLERVFRQG